MKRLDGVEVGALILLLAAIVLALLHWESVQRVIGYVLHEPPPATQAPAASPSPATPTVTARVSPPASQPAAQLQVPAASQPLPALRDSDRAFADALGELLGPARLAQWWVADHLIIHLVATIDNLPRAQVPQRAWPVRPTPGSLQVQRQDGSLVLAPANSARYAPYMAMVRMVDPQRLVAVYLRFYPLFQQAWRELGYPHGSFNQRLLQVIDNLLEAPEPAAALQLVQPHVLYQYADPGLEAASAGQKILMRIGPANERLVKAKLRALRAQLLLHMHAAAPAPTASQAH